MLRANAWPKRHEIPNPTSAGSKSIIPVGISCRDAFQSVRNIIDTEKIYTIKMYTDNK